MGWILNGLIGLATLLYPVAVFFGSQYFAPWQIAGLLVVLLSIRLIASYSNKHWSTPMLVIGIGFAGLAMWSNQLLTLRYYPVLMSILSLIIFSWTLFYPPTLIERLARLQHPDLPATGVIYTRRVTQVWCGFFIVNGLIAFATARWASMEIWSLYNGLIAYVLMGLLFAGEYLVRIKTQKHAR
jgi:uncharacterized membrane protein